MIHINGIDWQVEIVNPVLADPNAGLIGLTEFDKCTIQIRSGMPQQKQEATLFHELAHIVLGRESTIMHDEEGVVSRVGELLYAVFKDNRLLTEGWFDNLIDKQEFAQEDSKRVILDYDPPAEQSNESIRRRDYAEALPTSGREDVERSR